MEYQVWEDIYDERGEHREYLRWSGESYNEAKEQADFYGNHCEVKAFDDDEQCYIYFYQAGE